MKIGIIGLHGPAGEMARRLLAEGHTVYVYDRDADAVLGCEEDGAEGLDTIGGLPGALTPPRICILSMGSGGQTDSALARLAPILDPGDVIADVADNHYSESIRRADRLSRLGIHFVDVGVSGYSGGAAPGSRGGRPSAHDAASRAERRPAAAPGSRGYPARAAGAGGSRGYCLMAGGASGAVARLQPVFESLTGHSEHGYGHAGPAGSGHFVRMILDGIEAGMIRAFGNAPTNTESYALGAIVALLTDSGAERAALAGSIDLDVVIPLMTTALQRRNRVRELPAIPARLLSIIEPDDARVQLN